MKKKVLSIMVALLACVGVQAQIVSSSSRSIKTESARPSETMWYLRGGLNMAGFAGDGSDDSGRKAAYSVAVGFQKPIASLGAYWGMDFGLGSRGYKYDDGDYSEKLMANNIQMSPITLGWKYEVVDNLFIDGHVGAFLSVDYTGKLKMEDEYYEESESVSMGDWDGWNRFDVGMGIGFGLWYDRFNLDFTFQRGFIEAAEDSEMYTSNVMLRLGVAF